MERGNRARQLFSEVFKGLLIGVLSLIVGAIALFVGTGIGYNQALEVAYDDGFSQGYEDLMNSLIIHEMNLSLVVVGNTTSLGNASEDQTFAFNVTFENICRGDRGIFVGKGEILYKHCWDVQKLTPIVLIDCLVTDTYGGINIKPVFGTVNPEPAQDTQGSPPDPGQSLNYDNVIKYE